MKSVDENGDENGQRVDLSPSPTVIVNRFKAPE